MTTVSWGSPRAKVALAALTLLAARAGATPQFDPETTVSISSAVPLCAAPVSPPTIYPLRLYYLLPDSGTIILSAQSPDGTTWTPESSTGAVSAATLPSVSLSSVTGASVLPTTGGGFRMEYSVETTSNTYAIVSAKSADGLTWTNDPGVRLQVNSGAAYVGSPAAVQLQNGSWRMYYVQNTDGAADLANRAVYTVVSTDLGLTWSAPTVAVSTAALRLSASELTDGRVRLFFTEPPPGASTATVVLSALSADNSGTGFAVETGVRVSTPSTSALSGLAVSRSTDTFRWRLYYGEYIPSLGDDDALSSLTGEPAPTAVSPSQAYNSVSAVSLTVTGEIFSTPAPTFLLRTPGQPDLIATGVLGVNDETLTGTINPSGAAPGPRDLIVTNADGHSTTLTSAFTVTFPPGAVTLLDNLISPRSGTTATKIAITTFNPGQTTARVFTIDGRKVATLFDGYQPPGTLNLTWNGTFASGAPAPSGLYVLHVTGQKIESKQKIVVIR